MTFIYELRDKSEVFKTSNDCHKQLNQKYYMKNMEEVIFLVTRAVIFSCWITIIYIALIPEKEVMDCLFW